MLEFEEDIEDKVIDILKRCCDCYFNTSSFYTLSNEDIKNLRELNIDINQYEVNDEIYDNVYFKLKKIYPSNVFFKQTGFSERTGKIKLPFIMGSMDELKEGDLESWKTNCQYVVSAKLDGVSCGMVYKNGNLINAYSRGNGIEGQEILRHIYNLNTVIKHIDNKNTVFIRGELIVPKNEIQNMLDEIEEETGKRLKNGRNSVAGYINSKKGISSIEKHLKFIAYHIENFEGTEFEMFNKLNEYGFQTPNFSLKGPNEINENNLTSIVIDTKLNNEFECDGIILTQNEIQDGFDGFETGTHNPKKSRKYKIGAINNSTITEVENIEWNISKDGYLKPRIKIKPVDLVGVTVNYTTGHNYKKVIENHSGIGSKIKIKRAGDVIPWIEEVLEGSDNIPLPDCKYYEDGVELAFDYERTESNDIELAKKYLNEMKLQKLIYFCSKLNIDFAGEGNLRILNDYHKEITNEDLNIFELIQLDKSIFDKCIGINGIKLYESLHNKLQNMNECEFYDAVNCFGRGIGELKLKKIFNKYGTLCVNETQIVNTEGWSDKTCNQFMSHINDYFNWNNKLKELGIEFINDDNNEQLSNKYGDVKVCFTGIRDQNMEKIIVSNGGKILSSVNKECNLLVCKNLSDNSTKMKKAKEKEIEIIDYEQAVERFL